MRYHHKVKIDLREYIDLRGHNHYREWAHALDSGERARVIKSVLRMGEGNLSGVKPEGEGVSALRIDFGPGYRIYYGREGAVAYLLISGGDKSTQKADIKRAKEMWKTIKKESS